MVRRGLGRGRGKGYYNIVPRDPYIHSLSALGIKSKYLYHKTDFKKLPKIFESDELRPPTKDPLSMSEKSNPYLLFTKYEQPVSIVLDKSKIKGLVKIDYKGKLSVDYNDRQAYAHEKEVLTWDYPSADAIKEVIMLEKVKKLPERDFGRGAGGGRVIIGTPSRKVSVEDIKKGKIKYKRDESDLEYFDKGKSRINAKSVKLDPFKYQDTHQEQVIHSDIEKGDSYVHRVLEAGGDIFREFTQRNKINHYIQEKIDRIKRHFVEIDNPPVWDNDDVKEFKRRYNLNPQKTRIHPDDSYEHSFRHNQEKFEQMIEQWEQQPYKTKKQKLAIDLNIALLKRDFKIADRLLYKLEK